MRKFDPLTEFYYNASGLALFDAICSFFARLFRR